MSNPIQTLELIQRIDMEADSVREEKRRCEEDIRRVSLEVEAAERELEDIAARSKEIDAEIKELEEKKREADERIKKDEARQNSALSDKAQKALSKEIANARKVVKQAEDDLKKLSSKRGEVGALLDGKKSERDERKALLQKFVSEREEKTPIWEGMVSAKAGEKGLKAGLLPADIMKRYETLRTRRGGVAVVEARDETCMGCYMHIPPQLYIKLIGALDGIMDCPHCHRILFRKGQSKGEAS